MGSSASVTTSDTSPLCGWRLESRNAAPGAEWHRQPERCGDACAAGSRRGKKRES